MPQVSLESNSESNSKNLLFKSILLSVVVCLVTGLLILALAFGDKLSSTVNMTKQKSTIGASCKGGCGCSCGKSQSSK